MPDAERRTVISFITPVCFHRYYTALLLIACYSPFSCHVFAATLPPPFHTAEPFTLLLPLLLRYYAAITP